MLCGVGNMKQAIDESMGVSILRQVKLLNSLSDKQLLIISRSLKKETYDNGHVIITQGEAGDHFYMIANGDVSVTVNHVEVAKLTAGIVVFLLSSLCGVLIVDCVVLLL